MLRRFFENRSERITPELAAGFGDRGVLDRLVGLGLLEYDPSLSEYRMDDRLERFFEEMLGATEVAQADWLIGVMEELHRLINGIQGLTDSGKAEGLLRRIARLMRTCESRAQRQLEEITAAAEIDYRAGADYEVKLLKLQWHLERARNYGEAIGQLDGLLRNHGFFQIQRSIEIVSLRNRLIRRCDHVGDALIGIYQQIEGYLNRVQQDYARARKLIQLRGLLDRHEHLFATNLRELAESATGPWFRDLRFRTPLDPCAIDRYPQIVTRVLRRAGALDRPGKARRVEINDDDADEIPPVIEWQNVFETFSQQSEDLFTFLHRIKVEKRPLTEEEFVDGFCAMLTNEDWSGGLQPHPIKTARLGDWEYAVVEPITTLSR